MKAVAQIIKDMGLDLSEEQVKELDSKVRENYVTRNEHEEKLSRIEALTAQVGELSEKLEGTEDAETKIQGLQEQVRVFEEAEAQRQADEAEKAARSAFTDEFDKAVGDKRFVNVVTHDSVFDRAFIMRQENPSMGVEDILKQVIGDQGNIWANPQMEAASQPTPQNNTSEAEQAQFVARLFHRG